MVLTTSLSQSWKVLDSKEQKLVPLVVTLKLYMEFSKGQFSVHCFSISISISIFFDIIECDIAGYADDNTSCNFDFSLCNVISNLEKSNSLLTY